MKRKLVKFSDGFYFLLHRPPSKIGELYEKSYMAAYTIQYYENIRSMRAAFLNVPARVLRSDI